MADSDELAALRAENTRLIALLESHGENGALACARSRASSAATAAIAC
jgi:hypothetical protein